MEQSAVFSGSDILLVGSVGVLSKRPFSGILESFRSSIQSHCGSSFKQEVVS